LAVALEETVLPVTTNVADVEVAGTVTLVGTVAAAVLSLDRATTAPPAGAARVRVAVPVEVPPLEMLAGLTDMLASAGAVVVTARTAVFVSVPEVAVIVAEPAVVLTDVATLNDTDVAPAGTVTFKGTVATDVSELDRATI
jgi:hypothetical protein